MLRSHLLAMIRVSVKNDAAIFCSKCWWMPNLCEILSKSVTRTGALFLLFTMWRCIQHNFFRCFWYRETSIFSTFALEQFLHRYYRYTFLKLGGMQWEEVRKTSMLLPFIMVKQIKWLVWRKHQRSPSCGRNHKYYFHRHSHIVPTALIWNEWNVLCIALYSKGRLKTQITGSLWIIPIRKWVHIDIAFDVSSWGPVQSWSLIRRSPCDTSSHFLFGETRVLF